MQPEGLAPSPSVPVSAPGAPTASPAYWVPMLFLVLVAVYLLEAAFAAGAVPPGPDTAKWIATSYAYTGGSYPSAAALGNPYSYPPLLFPFLGLAVAIAGGPIGGGFLFAGALLLVYGLSLAHLARVYLRSGPLQVALVALGLFNLATVSMLFWGGYPNFLGLVFLNEALAFLPLFVRAPTTPRALGLYGALSATFLVHALAFVVALAAVAVAAAVLWINGRVRARVFASLPNVIGLGLLIGVVVVYAAVTSALGIPHPGYLTANPAAYQLDNVGQVFLPLAFGCHCSAGTVPVGDAVAVLIAAAVLSVGIPYVFHVAGAASARRAAARRAVGSAPALGNAMLVATAWLAAVCGIAAGGWLAHVDTDYNRLGYFFPLPLAAAGMLAVEAALAPVAVYFLTARPVSVARETSTSRGVGERATVPGPPTASRHPMGPAARGSVGTAVLAGAVVVVALVLAVPAYAENESAYGGPYADANFLAALRWLADSPGSEAVLTHFANAGHWVEAYAHRPAFVPDPTWLEFYASRVALDEECALAFHARYWVSDNRLLLSAPGSNDTAYAEAPLYSVLLDGVYFALLRVDARSLAVTEGAPPAGGGSAVVPEPAWGVPRIAYANGSLTLAWTTSRFAVTESLATPGSGSADVAWTVTPAAGASVLAISLNVTAPPTADRLLRSGVIARPSATPAGFAWTLRPGPLGVLAGASLLPTAGTFAPAASSETVGSGPTGPTISAGFRNPNPTTALRVSLSLATPGASNPAATLPSFFDTLGFLDGYAIRYVLLEGGTGVIGPATAQYFAAEYGFRPVYANPEWQVLAR